MKRVPPADSARGAAARLVTLTLLLVGCGFSSRDHPGREIRFGHVGAPGSLYSVSAEEFARRANLKLKDKGRIVVFGSSQLGGDEVLLQKLKLGTIDLALPSTVMSSIIDEFGLFEMPYLIQDRAHMRRLEAELFWPHLAPAAQGAGYRVLAVWENGFRHITNNVRPIETPDDLQGIKLRTPRGRWRVRMFRAFGANPTPMSLSEVFVALQTGVMDGQENPFAQIYSSKFHEVQQYLSLTGHVYTPAYLTTGAAHWDRWPAEVRQILETTAREMQEFVYETAVQMDRQLLQKLEDAGVQINQPQYDRFRAQSQSIYREFEQAVPSASRLIEKALALAASPGQ